MAAIQRLPLQAELWENLSSTHVDLSFQESVVACADKPGADGLGFLDIGVWAYLYVEQFVSGLAYDDRIVLFMECVAEQSGVVLITHGGNLDEIAGAERAVSLDRLGWRGGGGFGWRELRVLVLLLHRLVEGLVGGGWAWSRLRRAVVAGWCNPRLWVCRLARLRACWRRTELGSRGAVAGVAAAAWRAELRPASNQLRAKRHKELPGRRTARAACPCRA